MNFFRMPGWKPRVAFLFMSGLVLLSVMFAHKIVNREVSELASPTPTPQVRTVFGAYVGYHLDAMERFEDLVGQKTGAEMVFAHWGNDSEFPISYASRVRDKKKTMVLFWEAIDYNRPLSDQADYSLDAITRGDHDEYIRRFALGAQEYRGPIILIPFSEMNGNWFPWSGTAKGNSPEKIIAAYRHIRGFFRDAPNVKFGWAVNARDIPDEEGNRFELYYPGSDVVDVVGVDGFNYDGKEEVTFGQLFGSALERLQKFDKPIWIFSMGTAEEPTKPAWITDALVNEIPKRPGIVGWLWFNENKERDWRVDSSPASLSAFRDAVKGY